MELVVAVLGVMAVAAAFQTIRAVVNDGKGHLPRVRSHYPWTFESLPSEEYSRYWSTVGADEMGFADGAVSTDITTEAESYGAGQPVQPDRVRGHRPRTRSVG